MKRSTLLSLFIPVLCMASGAMRAFERFDPFYDYSETFYYGNIESSFNRPLAGVGLRYKDEEVGFDIGVSGTYATNKAPAVFQAEATVLFFPFVNYAYLGMGVGVSVETLSKIYGKTFLRGAAGAEYRSLRFGKYFAEATFQAPTRAGAERFRIFPGFRIGVGF